MHQHEAAAEAALQDGFVLRDLDLDADGLELDPVGLARHGLHISCRVVMVDRGSPATAVRPLSQALAAIPSGSGFGRCPAPRWPLAAVIRDELFAILR